MCRSLHNRQQVTKLLDSCPGFLCSPVPQLCQRSVQHLWMRICLTGLICNQEPSLSNTGGWRTQEMWSGVQTQRYFFLTKCKGNGAQSQRTQVTSFLLFFSAQVHVGKLDTGFYREEGCFGSLLEGWPCGGCICGVHRSNLRGNIHFALATFSQRPAVWASGLVQHHSGSVPVCWEPRECWQGPGQVRQSWWLHLWARGERFHCSLCHIPYDFLSLGMSSLVTRASIPCT